MGTKCEAGQVPRLPLAYRLGDENRDAPCGPCLVLCVRRIGRDGEIPEACPLGLVLDLGTRIACTAV